MESKADEAPVHRRWTKVARPGRPTTGFWGLVVAPTAVLLVLSGCVAPPASSGRGSSPGLKVVSGQVVAPLLSDSFGGGDGLITNEYAYWNPSDPSSVVSPVWELDSGSLFRRGGAGWTGVPDDRSPDATSSSGNNSAVFRLTTRRSDFGDVSVSFRLRNDGLSSTGSTPPVDWDGVHVFLRYQSEFSLYYASVNRRDGTVVIKKKVPGGPDNGGTYYELTPYVAHAVPYGQWQNVTATVRNVTGGVQITLSADGVVLAQAVDRGVGGPAITSPGKVGLRGDNANVSIDDFTVTAP
jgi:hypothetical protein